MNTNDQISLDSQQSAEKKSSKGAFVVGGLVGLGLAAAIGFGFVIGGGSGRSGNAATDKSGSVAGVTSNPTQAIAVSPTAASQHKSAAPAGKPAAAGDNASQTSNGSSSNDGSSSSAPAPTNTSVPPAATNTAAPAATNTAVPPTNTPVPPTSTPTATPTATATPSGPCVICLDPSIILCIPCLTLDVTPPTITTSYLHCFIFSTYNVHIEVNEESDIFVTYNLSGVPTVSSTVHGLGADFSLGGVFSSVDSIIVHAKDNAGNTGTAPSLEAGCF